MQALLANKALNPAIAEAEKHKKSAGENLRTLKLKIILYTNTYHNKYLSNKLHFVPYQ